MNAINSDATVIEPTIGRRVWFFPDPTEGATNFRALDITKPMDAGVVFVHGDRCVNLDVCDHLGNHHAFTSVTLLQADDPVPKRGRYATWMPFQKGQAKAAAPASESHASRVLYPAIRNAMEELGALHQGFNDHVNRAWNYLHGAFWSESPAPASAPGLRDTLAAEEVAALPATYTFEQFITYGRKGLEAPDNIPRAPWSFLFWGHAVTHEADDHYLIAGNYPGHVIHFKKGETLVVSAAPHIQFATSEPARYDIYVKPVEAEEANRPIKFDFGDAIRHLKDGRRVARAGWNGKGMFVYLNRGSECGSEMCGSHTGGVPRRLFDAGDFGTVTRMPNFNMRAADGSTVTGWLASQTDMLAEDWVVVE